MWKYGEFLRPIVANWNMLQFSFAAHDCLYLYPNSLQCNKSNFPFKGKSRISIDSFNKINISILQFNIKNFQKSNNLSFSINFRGIQFSQSAVNYDFNWNNLYEY